MDDVPESSTTLAWIWVIEALASFKEIDFSIIHDVIESAPELPDEEGKKAKEIVAFRCLEGLFGSKSVIGKNDASTQDSKIGFDLSESSEDVLQRILYETSESVDRMGGPGTMRWDVSTFISHKRACMPKSELQKLKDTILDNTHPYADLLKEKSGLTCVYKSRSISVCGDCNNVERNTISDAPCAHNKFVLGNKNGNPSTFIIEEGFSGDKRLVSKRKWVNSPSTSMIDRYNENHDVTCGGDDVSMSAKKHEQLSTPSFPLEELNQAVLCRKKVLEEMSDKVIPNDETREYNMVEDQIGASDERTHDIDIDGNCASRKKNRQIDYYDLDQLGSTGASFKAQEARGGEAHQDISGIEVNYGSEVLIEPNKSSVSPPECNNHHPSKDSKCNSEQDFQVKKSNLGSYGHYQQICADQMEVDMDHSVETEILSDCDGYQSEQIDVIEKRSNFLSSQSQRVLNDDSSLPADQTELNLCVKCSEGGRLLYCNNGTCPLVVHEQCVGILVSFNEKGEFYCPFCAYLLAMSEHLDAKKKASFAKRELADFIRNGLGHQIEEFSYGLHRKEKNYSSQNGDEYRCTSVDTEHLGKVEVCLGKNDVKVGENVNVGCNLESTENQNNQDEYHDAPSEFVNEQPGEVDAALTREAIGNIVGREDEDGQMAQEPVFVAGTDRQEGQEATDGKDDYYISNKSIENKIVLADQGPEKAGLQLVVYQQQEVDVACKPVYAFNNEEESSENDDESIISQYSISFREQKRHCTYPLSFQQRRKKVPWTTEEEEILKEGVQKIFSVHDRNIPWMRILEFGGAVFYKGRTPVDLKDKWRNMCKSINLN